MHSGKQRNEDRSERTGQPTDDEVRAQAFVDSLVGEAMLEGVRLRKVREARARLLAGEQKELVLAFARDAVQGSRDDRFGCDLYALFVGTGKKKPVA